MSNQQDYPNLGQSSSTNNNANQTFQNAKDAVINNAQSAYNTVANHPTTQNLMNGPAAEKARLEADKTSQEFSNVLDSRKVPDTPAATGQPLTQYHSMFYNILSWENPRVTTISFASTITFIFFTRYVPVLKYTLKALYIVLGITAGAEVIGKLVLNRGIASQVRPRKYYTIPRESLEASIDDVEQLVNFFVIEFQRIIFAENVYATVAAFTAALIGYFLVKFVPTWGIALIGTTAVYLLPLLYIKNRDVIDEHLNNASNVISEQATQVRDLAAHHTSRAAEVVQNTASEYTAKAQEMMGQAKDSANQTASQVQNSANQAKENVKNSAASSDAPNPANLNPMKNEPGREIKKEDFPSAPSSAPSTSTSGPTSASNNPFAVSSGPSGSTSGSAYGSSNPFASTSDPTSASSNPFATSSAPTGGLAAGEPRSQGEVLKDNFAYHENSNAEKVRSDAADHIGAETIAQ